MRLHTMVITKIELQRKLEESTSGVTLINCNMVYGKIIEILEWDDDEPRDLKAEDIARLEDWVADELDIFLGRVEKLVS